jgi:phospholipase C
LRNPRILAGVGVGLVASAALAASLTMAGAASPNTSPAATPTTTPIKHVVVIFDENVSFDHYFGTYPNATNPAGEPAFTAAPGTPKVNGLTPALLSDNPNRDTTAGSPQANPKRLDNTGSATPSQVVTCDQGHSYSPEQKAADGGLMDRFPQFTGGGGCADKAIVMDYYDGNTVTGLWNYAQHYAMSDNSFDTNYGPSSPGAVNVISGDNGGVDLAHSTATSAVENDTLINDADPTYDDCSAATHIAMSGQNIGDLLNAKDVSWGWFQGGFTPSSVANGKAVCGTAHNNIIGASDGGDYIQHHEPFQYYASTANPHHLPPTSVAAVGHQDQANHQYDLSYFYSALSAGNLPSVSYVKAAAYEDGHAGYSDPLDEQVFLANTINAVEQSPDWSSTAIVIAYDDSDGWYDHVFSPLTSPSAGPSDALTGTGKCGTLPTPLPADFENDRCGLGPRLPLLVISPYAKVNYVDHTLTDQSSVVRFIEDNWSLGRIGGGSTDATAGTLDNMFNFTGVHQAAPRVILDPSTGEVLSTQPGGLSIPGLSPVIGGLLSQIPGLGELFGNLPGAGGGPFPFGADATAATATTAAGK